VRGNTYPSHASGHLNAQLTAVPPADKATCIYGCRCKGRRGLKAHQRSCEPFKTVLNTDYSTQAADGNTQDDNATRPPQQASIDPTLTVNLKNMTIKTDIRLPKSHSRWEEAN